jgi:hypothetical protein
MGNAEDAFRPEYGTVAAADSTLATAAFTSTENVLLSPLLLCLL